MGSEQSHHQADPRGDFRPGVGGGGSFGGGHGGSGDFPPMSPTLRSQDGGTISPSNQESVCSDSEVPYVSYTVNRPISESPKKKPSFYKLRLASAASAATSGLTSGKRSVSMDVSFGQTSSSKSKTRSKHDTLVVVNKGGGSEDRDLDPELQRLRDTPSFLPIIRCSTNATGAAITKDPDILEALDHRGLQALAARYQNHLRFCAGVVSTEQAEICRRVRDVDDKIAETAMEMSQRQKAFNKHAEGVKNVTEMTKILNKCHMLLNENIEQIEILNNMLPVEERLEPFVWTTG